MNSPRISSINLHGRLPGSAGLVASCILLLLAAAALSGMFGQAGVAAFKETDGSTRASVPPPLATLSESASARFESGGNRRINLSDGRALLSAYDGAAEAVLALQRNDAAGLAIASADFDEDGVPDVVSGYESQNGGLLTLHRGNVDSIYPNAPEAKQRRATGRFTDAPFLSPARVFHSTETPELLGAGDFDADDHRDVVTAKTGSKTLWFYPGDGKGGFAEPRPLMLDGAVTALEIGEVNRRDGLEDIVVCTTSPTASKALVFESPLGAINARPEEFRLSARATSIALDQLVEGYERDLVIAAGRKLIVITGRDRKLSIDAGSQAPVEQARVSIRSLNFNIKSLVTGNFGAGSTSELAILGDDGKVRILRGPASDSAGRKRMSIDDWRTELLETERCPMASKLVRARVSSNPSDSLLILDGGHHRLTIIDQPSEIPAGKSGQTAIRASSSGEALTSRLVSDSEPTAVLPMRLNSTALSSLVVLNRGRSSPGIVFSTTATFTVDDTGDTPDANPGNGVCDDGGGNCTLRAAIEEANANPGADTINFSIGAGAQTISPASALATITEALTLDGTTQPGFGGTPIIEIDCTNLLFDDGLLVTAGNSTIRGLVINRSPNTGDAIQLETGGSNIIEGNFVGTDVSGTAVLANNIRGVFVSNSAANRIGGTVAAAQNLISGNLLGGVVLDSGSGTILQGNIIGTDVTGTVALGNGVSFGTGVFVNDNQTIGGTLPGAGNLISGGDFIELNGTANLVQGNVIGTDATGSLGLKGGVDIQGSANTVGGVTAAARNLISGNVSSSGVNVIGSNNLIQGNLIGTNASGTSPVPSSTGVAIGVGSGSTVGGTVPGARNIISGNVFGIALGIGGGNTVQGNFIGTDITGTIAVPNNGDGVNIFGGNNNIIGGTAAGARNIISGNVQSGVVIANGSNNQVQGNFIGTDVSGNVALPNGSFGPGSISIQGTATNNTIGGTAAGTRNVISGNIGNGVTISGAATGNQIQGNLIGTNPAGTAALQNGNNGITVDAAANLIGGTSASARNVISGNAAAGIALNVAATNNTVQGNFVGIDITGAIAIPNANGILIGGSNNTIGGTAAGAANIIAFNGGPGINVGGGSGNRLLTNSIFSNAGLGIDLNGDGVTANDAGDADAGPNNLQNFPVLASAQSAGTTTQILGSLNSTASSSFRIEFFSNTACDGSGNGEGTTLIGFTNVTTDGSGNATINVTLPVAVPLGSAVVATATDPSNNTSEFSACSTVTLLSCGITCPGNQVVSASPAQCGAAVTYAAPVVTGSCGAVSCSPPSGNVFAVGSTTVTCTTGVGPTCAFVVTVIDDRPPVLNCPPNISKDTDPGRSTAVIDYVPPAPTDNCPSVTSICLPPSGFIAPIGATTVSCIATDASNNTAACSFIVTVGDAELPGIQCPQNLTRNMGPNQGSAVVTYPPPLVNDNLPGAVATCAPPSGASFPLGVTTVSCSARDSIGNQASCSFTVTLVGGTPTGRIIFPGGGLGLEFGTQSPAPVNPKPKPGKAPCGLFSIENTGFAPLELTLESILRAGADVEAGRISDPAERESYELHEVLSGGRLSLIPVGSTLVIEVGAQKNFCLKFAPAIPALAGTTTGLRAPQAIPDVVNSRVRFVAGGFSMEARVNARVVTAARLINPTNPRKKPLVSFSSSGNELSVSFAVFDANLDVNKARYEFVDAGGNTVAGPFDVDLVQPIRDKNLVRGQSFSVEQRFSGAASHPEIRGVRVTVNDGEGSVAGSAARSSTAGVASLAMRQPTSIDLPTRDLKTRSNDR
jgi:CSLREA domain-containing protein